MSVHQLGDAPIEAKYRKTMLKLARHLDRELNGRPAQAGIRETGFVLMVFPFGSPDGRCNYISNGADRADIVVLMREMIARFEGQPEMEGNA